MTENFPVVHDVHTDTPSVLLKLPASHTKHEDGDVAPRAGEYLPVLHTEQNVAPVTSEYFPGGQSTQRGKHDTTLNSPVEQEHEEPFCCPSKHGLLLLPRSRVDGTLKRLNSADPEHVAVPLMFADPAAIASSLALAVRLPAREIRSTPVISRFEADTVPCSVK